MSDYGVVGFVVNPKLATLLLATWEGDSYVSIRDLKAWKEMGGGYYGSGDDPASNITGLPRSHTPDGVKERGKGYGTSLYTALALGATVQEEGYLGIDTGGFEGAGICSKEGERSSSAEEWWTLAKERDLADSMVDEIEEQMDLSDYVDDITDCVSGLDGNIEIDSVSQLEADVTIRNTADIYMYRSATDHNLVALSMPLPTRTASWSDVLESAWKNVDISEGEVATVLAADLRGASPAAVRLLMAGSRVAGASEEELDELYFRWSHGLDPSVPFAQLRLPFKANSAEARKAQEILEKTAYLRKEAGWAELADLP